MYGHPYTPYEVQKQFMQALYESLSEKRVSLFESPTGTGKTLSLLCPAVAWLRDSSERELATDLAKLEAAGGPAWLVENAKKMRVAEYDAQRAATAEIAAAAARVRELPTQAVGAEPVAKRQRREQSREPGISEFLLEDNAIDDALAEFEQSGRDSQSADPRLEPLRAHTRIYFASRTHSQLTQVAGALAELRIDPPARFAALASRRQLCIHKDVRALRSVTQMNEKCADLQKHAKCTYRTKSDVVRDQMLGEIMDIEDLARFGREHASCPYYAARDAAPYAEVVALPYAMLLTRRNREALGIDLAGSVVVVDEAHNLVDAVTGLHSATLTARDVERALRGLSVYDSRIGSRLSPSNRRKVRQVMRLIESLAAYFARHPPTMGSEGGPNGVNGVNGGSSIGSKGSEQDKRAQTGTLSSGPVNSVSSVKPGTRVDAKELLAEGNADTLDIAELAAFVRSSKLVFKVDSYVEATQPGERTGSLGTAVDFLLAATDPAAEGKLYEDVDATTGELCLRYLVLDAAPAFREVVDEARSVVLAGGTMEPMSEFTDQLLPYVRSEDRALQSYGHIVPKSQLLVMAVPGVKLTFANRSLPGTVAELGRELVRIVSSVPHGVVAFFPGYKYLASVVRAWQRTGVFAELEKHKRVFAESASGQEDVFPKFSGHARKMPGALLLAVVGGRLSEGINFSDELARAVVMVGLPFPNAFSAEMVAKREFIETQARRTKSPAEAKEAARQYYENVAMRAVNQSVGRSIRHIRDYAAIFLIDDRYTSRDVQAKLSRWVRESLETSAKDLEARTREFFNRNKQAVKAS